jgi:hypothetical protein
MSKSMFRMALEGETVEMTSRPNEPTIVMSGPLSEIFTKALDITYAKADPVSGTAGIAQESQAQDVTVMQKIVESINNNSQQSLQAPAGGEGQFEKGYAAPTSGADLQVYGVAKQDITDADVVDVADALMNEDAESKPKDFVVVVDSTIPGANGPGSSQAEEIEYLSEAMESLTKKLGGRFYHSFEAFVDGQAAGDKNEGADGTGAAGDPKKVEAQQGGEGFKGDPGVNLDALDPSLTSRVVEIAKIAREEAAGTTEAAAEAGDGGETSAAALEDGNTDTGQPVVKPVLGLPNDPGALSPEAQAAISAGKDKVPLPKKDGEINPQVSNGGDPTEPVANGESVATEGYRVRIVTLAPRQRVRARS